MSDNLGMQFSYYPHNVDKQGEVRRVAAIHKGGKRIARLSLFPQTGEIDRIYVDDEHRRQGLATHLFNYTKEMEEKAGYSGPKHSSRMTQAGYEWAKSVGGQLPEKVKIEEEQV